MDTTTSQAPTLPESSELIAAIKEAIREEIADLTRAPSPEPVLLSVDDVANHLQVSRRTVEKIIAGGDLQPLWIRGQRRFHPKVIDAYLRRCAKRK